MVGNAFKWGCTNFTQTVRFEGHAQLSDPATPQVQPITFLSLFVNCAVGVLPPSPSGKARGSCGFGIAELEWESPRSGGLGVGEVGLFEARWLCAGAGLLAIVAGLYHRGHDGFGQQQILQHLTHVIYQLDVQPFQHFLGQILELRFVVLG